MIIKQRITRFAVYVLLLTPVLLVAICNRTSGEVLTNITDSNIRSYINYRLESNPPELNVVSAVLTREGKIALRNGDEDKGVMLLSAAADISSSNTEPYILLARTKFLNADPGFIIDLLNAARIEAGSFYKSAILYLNMYILLLSAAGLALAIYLITLAVKYNEEIFHRVEEAFSKRFRMPRPEYLGLSALAAILLLRPGFALYIVLLSVIVWRFISRKEKTVLSTMIILIALSSLFNSHLNNLGPVLDESSITRRLSRINEEGGTDELLREIRDIDRAEFSAEKNFALGTLMFRRGDLADARKYLKRAISEREDFLPAYINLGNVYFMQKDFDRALAGYRNVTGLDSTNAIAHYNIGQTCIQKMHFSLSSTALKKARRFGIDRYRRNNPVVEIRNPEVLTCGFSKSHLREIAARESGIENFSILDIVFRKLIFVPVGYLWFMLPAALVSGILISKTLPRRMKIEYCGNCGKPVCPECLDSEKGIGLCPECSSVVDGLSSTKVMEALLRRRRQNRSNEVLKRKWRAVRIIPGGKYILKDRTVAGFLTMISFAVPFNILISSGLYFKDPRFSLFPVSAWRLIAPLAVIALIYVLSFRISKPEGEKRYYILPQDIQGEGTDAEEEQITDREELEEALSEAREQELDPFGTFIDSI